MTPVTTRVEGHVARIAVEPPEGRHDRAFAETLAAAAAEVGGMEEVRAVIVSGAFGRGWAEAALQEPLGLSAGVEAVAALPQPVIAAVGGPAHSAGLELALACDIRVAAADATFAMPETEIGGLPLAGGTQRLPRAVGRAAALRLLLLGEEIDAAEALRIGLVSRVVPAAELEAAAGELAKAIAERGPIATRLAKEAVHRGAEMTLAQALRYELDLTVLLQSTADRAEGVRAFAARRPPRFIGR